MLPNTTHGWCTSITDKAQRKDFMARTHSTLDKLTGVTAVQQQIQLNDVLQLVMLRFLFQSVQVLFTGCIWWCFCITYMYIYMCCILLGGHVFVALGARQRRNSHCMWQRRWKCLFYIRASNINDVLCEWIMNICTIYLLNYEGLYFYCGLELWPVWSKVLKSHAWAKVKIENSESHQYEQ